jgi:hypothetical protein
VRERGFEQGEEGDKEVFRMDLNLLLSFPPCKILS